MLANCLLATKIYNGNTKNTAVIRAAKADDLSRITIAVLRSALRS